MTKRLRVALCLLAFLAILEATQVNAQCVRLKCDQTQRCQANLIGDGHCCCKVACTGGQGQVECTCTTWCEHDCGTSCPTCDYCTSLFAAAGDEGFVLTPQAQERVRQQSMLAAQVLSNLSDHLSHPVYYSGIVEGSSNADFWYDYSYTLRIAVTPAQLSMDFVFDLPDGAQRPQPMRITIDEFDDVFVSRLSPEDTDRLRFDAAVDQ
jgi:hypothetical protein